MRGLPRCGQGSTVRRYHAVNPAASIAPCRCWARFAVAQVVQRRDPGLEIAGIRRMQVQGNNVTMILDFPVRESWKPALTALRSDLYRKRKVMPDLRIEGFELMCPGRSIDRPPLHQAQYRWRYARGKCIREWIPLRCVQ
jgi:hypothetical protein